MASPIDISNLALGWLGKPPITSLEDETVEAGLCKLNYPLSRDSVSGAAEFTFTTKRFVLAQDTDKPVFGDYNQFLLPKEVIRVFDVNNNRAADFEDPLWLIEGRHLLLRDSEARIRAAVRVEDSETFSPEFTRCVAARLAADIAIAMTQSKTVEDAMEERYRMYLRDAKTQDGRQGTSKKLVSRWLNRSRWSNGGSWVGPTV
jgi:hypothetical protein